PSCHPPPRVPYVLQIIGRGPSVRSTRSTHSSAMVRTGGGTMTAPFVLISTWKVKEGAYRDYEAWFQGLVAHVESGNPRMIAFHTFASEDGSKLMGVQVHPDVASMDLHLRLVAEYAAAAQQAYLDQPLHLLVGGEGDQARE